MPRSRKRWSDRIRCGGTPCPLFSGVLFLLLVARVRGFRTRLHNNETVDAAGSGERRLARPGYHGLASEEASHSPEGMAALLRNLVWLCVGLLVLATGCMSSSRRLSPEVDCARPSLIMFFVDGMDHARLHQMLAAGELPHIQKRFVEGGVRVRHAFSSLPSITYPNCSSMITGRFPGHHGIMGNFWFDRASLFAPYYMTLGTYRTVNQHLEAPTLYDVLHDEFTLSFQHHTRKGATMTIDNKDNFALAWVLGRYSLADQQVFRRAVSDAIAAANRQGRWPRIIMTYFPGVDEVGHRFGSPTPQYGEALRVIDQTVGRVTGQIDEAGLSDCMYYALVTDHSHPPIHQHVDILKWAVRHRGARLRTQALMQARYRDRFRLMQRYDTVGSVDAGRTASFHLRHGPDWSCRPPEEVVREWITREPSLLEVPAVEMVTMRAGPDRVRALSREGSLVVERRVHEGVKQYRVIDQEGDLLKVADRPALAAFIQQGWHTSREWLVAMVEERYPDLVPQIMEMFDSTHTGDVVVFAASEWGFAIGPAEHGGHGSCLACDMRVPMMFSGPGLPHGASIDFARLVDVTPTVLGLIGEAERIPALGEIDGINLADELRKAR